MGLDAHVRCTCIRDGIATPHPLPSLLAFDETGAPTLESKAEITLEQWLLHDKWDSASCPHSGRLLEKRLGNISSVGFVRKLIEETSINGFPLISGRVAYSGTHSGDWIAASDAPQLLSEATKLHDITSDPLITQFANDLIDLAEASRATGNPIVF